MQLYEAIKQLDWLISLVVSSALWALAYNWRRRKEHKQEKEALAKSLEAVRLSIKDRVEVTECNRTRDGIYKRLNKLTECYKESNGRLDEAVATLKEGVAELRRQNGRS